MEEEKTQDTIMDNELMIINTEKESAYNYRERRHDDWRDNYTLSRDKVITNRLTQRQTINVPLMKYGLATILKDIDEPAVTTYRSLSNSEESEIFFNEGWLEFQRINKARLKDRAFKKHLTLYGRAFRKLNITNGKFVYSIVLPENMLVDRYIDPLDIDSARILIQINIFRTLTSIIGNEDYDKAGRDMLDAYYSAESRQVESATNTDRMNNQNQKMRDMGVVDIDNPVVGTTIVELNEIYRKEYDTEKKEDVIMVYVVGATNSGLIKLAKKPLEEILGETKENAWRNHFPYTTAGADPEADDFWSDAPADTLRQPNKILNSFVSSMVENRVLRNYNMHYYDSSNASFIPQTFTPTPWAWFPMPGNPNEMVKDVIVGDLSESLDEMQFVIDMAEKAVAVTSVQTGELPSTNIKLGQTELALANAKERTKSILVPVEQEYQDFAQKYIWMIEASGSKLDDLTVSKKGRKGEMMFTKTLTSNDYVDQMGYVAEVKMREDRDREEASTIQKLQVAKMEMPGNLPLMKIFKKRLLDFADLKANEIQEVMDYDEQNPMPLIDPALMGANPQQQRVM